MDHAIFRRALAVGLALAFAGAARAEDAGKNVAVNAGHMSPLVITRALTLVLNQASTAPSANFADTERRPPQAAPADPSYDPSAPPDPRKVRRALGGFIGGMVGLAAGSVVGSMTHSGGIRAEHFAVAWPTAGVAIGIVLGTSLGGR
jgi:hypothetical protein